MASVEPGFAKPHRPRAAALPVLDDGVIQLGPWPAETADADAEALARLHADPAGMRYWSIEPWTPGDRARAEAYLDDIEAGARDGDLMQFAARLPGSPALVGWVTLYRIERTHRRAEIGYLIDTALWGRGLGRRMVALALDHAFGALALHKIEADVDPRNAASRRMLESLGFQREGLLRQRWRTGGELQDSAMYGLIADEWRG
ncbi:GNAT family N-acetyltransferase [Silanimonas sp.]|jgi:RimJ/RimL family protein N-acetyltransferase|uniref:GNAT family N-acetyltransferase n=1 Tax=Silanimonas sp. TaxID=1929290 RepID=UPI0037C671FE